MLNFKQIKSGAYRYKRHLEMTLVVELLGLGKKKVPRLEYGDDAACYFDGKANLIHLGLSFFHAENLKDLFEQLFYLRGHETQHYLSTTAKDWDAALNLCFRDACQALAGKVLGKPKIRLVKDEDYDRFFEELNAKGVYVSKRMIMSSAHRIINTLEDGRIELIREKKNPGFRIYRKLFRGKMWLDADIRDEEGFKEDPADLTPVERYNVIMSQVYFLATTGIYQKGFLAAYGYTDLHDEVMDLIPIISKAVLSRTCKGCMEQARILFNKYLDPIIEICKDAAEAEKFMQALANAIAQVLMNESMESTFSADPNSEEQGDGLPTQSLFGKTDLEIEVDKETFDRLKEQAEEEGEGLEGLGVTIKCSEEDTESGENGDENSGSNGNGGSGSSEDSKSEEAKEGNSGSSASGESSDEKSEKSGSTDGESDEKSGDEKESGPSDKGGSEGETEKSETESGDAKGEGDSEGNASNGEAEGKAGADSEGGTSSHDLDASKNGPEVNEGKSNKVDGSVAGEKLDAETLEQKIRDEMQAAADAPCLEYDLAEADSKMDEKFKAAAEKLNPVEPAEIDLSAVNSTYDQAVDFTESVRVYTPSDRLPYELENKGRSLKRKTEELVKNKQEPDMRFLKSGLFDTRRIDSLVMGDPAVFKKKGDPATPDVAAFILMDNSGSMGYGPGSTRNACCSAAAVIEEGFKDFMALKIAAFDAWGDYSVTHEVVKEFDEKCEANLSYNFMLHGRDGCGNKDGYSIRVATKQLAARPEKDKILIIASDGYPTEYAGGYREGVADVKMAVNEARRLGIKTIGMYMYHTENADDFAVFKDMYAPEIIFASLDQIEDEMTRILGRYFR